MLWFFEFYNTLIRLYLAHFFISNINLFPFLYTRSPRTTPSSLHCLSHIIATLHSKQLSEQCIIMPSWRCHRQTKHRTHILIQFLELFVLIFSIKLIKSLRRCVISTFVVKRKLYSYVTNPKFFQTVSTLFQLKGNIILNFSNTVIGAFPNF